MVDADNHKLSTENSIKTFDKYFNNSENRISDKLMILYIEVSSFYHVVNLIFK